MQNAVHLRRDNTTEAIIVFCPERHPLRHTTFPTEASCTRCLQLAVVHFQQRASAAEITIADAIANAPEREGWFRWTAQLEVVESWVAAGFDLTDDRALAMLANDLKYAYGHELKAKVIARPDDARVAKAQGYESVGAYRAARKGDK